MSRTYSIYLHGSKESSRQAALDAGFTNEEIDDLDLQYVGYEEQFEVTVKGRNVHIRHVPPASKG